MKGQRDKIADVGSKEKLQPSNELKEEKKEQPALKASSVNPPAPPVQAQTSKPPLEKKRNVLSEDGASTTPRSEQSGLANGHASSGSFWRTHKLAS